MNWITVRTIATYQEWQLPEEGDEVPGTCTVELQRFGDTYRWFAQVNSESDSNEGAPSDVESEAWVEGLAYALEQQRLFM